MGSTLSDERKAKALDFFNSIDTDHSGTISLREIGKKLKMKKKETMRLIDSIDQDGNHMLDFEEFLVLFETRYKGLFSDIDSDGNGFISGDEFVTFIQALGFDDVEQIQSYVNTLDTDGNSRVEFLEFVFGLLDLGVY